MRTNLQYTALQAEPSASISKRCMPRGTQETSETFSESLNAASKSLQSTASQIQTSACETSTISRYINTASIDDGVSTTQSLNSGNSESESTSQTVTPFDPLPLEDNPPRNSWRDYFMTHQPGEWWQDAATREIFAGLYGSKALVTLDYTGTVPENEDAKWVTSVPLDAAGKPFPAPAPPEEV